MVLTVYILIRTISSLSMKVNSVSIRDIKNQGDGVCNFSGPLIGFSFLVWIFVQSHISDCGFGVYRATSFAVDQILTGV